MFRLIRLFYGMQCWREISIFFKLFKKGIAQVIQDEDDKQFLRDFEAKCKLYADLDALEAELNPTRVVHGVTLKGDEIPY